MTGAAQIRPSRRAARSRADETPTTRVAVSDSPAPLLRLRKRPDFLALNRGARAVTQGFILLARARRRHGPEGPHPARLGVTCSKKLGNAVARNRAKRRLRALAAQGIAPHARAGWDYALIGRPGATVARDFPDLLADLAQAVDRVHAQS